MAGQQRRGLPPEPEEPDTARLADLPVDELPPDAPDRARAAVDDVPDDFLDAGGHRPSGPGRVGPALLRGQHGLWVQ